MKFWQFKIKNKLMISVYIDLKCWGFGIDITWGYIYEKFIFDLMFLCFLVKIAIIDDDEE
ncbi:MAG TPA: hypothetical protein ENG63_09780 [Candidatus Desulfofervidus auxilii]|uniref:Uncharacterized protein n=1 Tax=Desulfofervidus auxilii TaxID=1621989 RepID=A0A7C0Y8H7_DESA2|nr:hypothetical protein [Candidatus Desulfofervidus auxilii]